MISDGGTKVVLDPYELPPSSHGEVGAMETQKPLDAKALLEETLKVATDARYAMQEAVAVLDSANVTSVASKLRDAHNRLVAQVEAARAAIGPKEHVLKCDPGPFRAVWAGLKPFEVRAFDRDFRVGDVLKLLEHDRETGHYSGAKIRARVTHIVKPGEYGLPPNLGVLGIEVLDKKEA